jgi:hypothetical protein
VAARDFWLDPTHVRPVHPEFLRDLAIKHSFETIELRPLHPYDEELPAIPLAEVSAELQPLADRCNRLRDGLQDLLFGHRDYALIARRPG